MTWGVLIGIVLGALAATIGWGLALTDLDEQDERRDAFARVVTRLRLNQQRGVDAYVVPADRLIQHQERN